MVDIFISYAREDIERVRPIVKELEKLGWSVFWDTKIQPGDNWPIEITEALKSSRCVLVFWSFASVDFKIHHWIRAEAEFGRKKGILVPLLLDEVEIPIEFSHLQAADLSGWKKKFRFRVPGPRACGYLQNYLFSSPDHNANIEASSSENDNLRITKF